MPTVGDDIALGIGDVVRELTALGGAEEPGVAIGVGGGTSNKKLYVQGILNSFISSHFTRGPTHGRCCWRFLLFH